MKAKKLLITLLAFGMLLQTVPAMNVSAEELEIEGNTPIVFENENDDSNRKINDSDRERADADLLYYMQSLEVRYKLDKKIMENLHKLFDSAVYYIANSENMTVSELNSYIASTKANMESTALMTITTTTSEFLQVANNWVTPTVSHGQSVSIVLPIINLGTEELNDLVIEPKTSNLVTEWPFEPSQSGFIQTEPFIPGNKTYDSAMANRREFTYVFKARENVMSGFYPLTFLVSYTKAGVRCAEPIELTVYVQTIGKPESGVIGGNGQEQNKAKPRIIVTGFETNPATVYAGSTFTLYIHIKNTSKETAVTNALFDLQAAVEGQDKNSTYSAFLPTSGASSVYMDRIGAGESADIEIEMTAKADLAQKPYVLDVNMTYDAGTVFDLKDKASVSIPISQESRFDTSIPEIMPSEINVGEQSNVMFSIYNTGKTTLYNVRVNFEDETIETNSAFVGNLQSGATGNVDVMLTGMAPTGDDGLIPIEISFEDEGGNITSKEMNINLFVNEMVFDDYPMDEIVIEDEAQGSNSLARIIIIVLIVVAVVAGVTIFLLKRNKKKKADKELAEDLADLEAAMSEEAKDKETQNKVTKAESTKETRKDNKSQKESEKKEKKTGEKKADVKKVDERKADDNDEA